MAALSVIKKLSFWLPQQFSFKWKYNRHQILHSGLLCSSAICEIIRSYYLTSEIRASELEECGWVRATHLSLEFAYSLGVPWNHHPWWFHMAQLNKCFFKGRAQTTHIKTTQNSTKNEDLPDSIRLSALKSPNKSHASAFLAAPCWFT